MILPLHDKFAATRRELSAALIERDEEVDLCLTAMIAREHAMLVGPPGTAKSMLADAMVGWMRGSKFSILLTKFTTPEEVFGPVSLAGLKADHYRRITAGKLPEASVAFIDEVFKASSAILNTLLTVLNERTYDNDGERMTCPLQLCIGASNEWPGGNGDGTRELGALFDRFLFRKSVAPISTERGIQRLLWGPIDVALSTTISAEEVTRAADAASALPWSGEAKEAFTKIMQESRSEGISPGDRRLRKSVQASRAYAWLNGRTEVTPDDLEILAHTLWDDPAEQPHKLAKIVGKIANPARMKVNSLLMEGEQLIRGTNLSDLAATATACKKLSEILGKLKSLAKTDAGGQRAADAASYVGSEIKRIRLATVEAL
jgi:MoxR-like ATPase